MDRFFKSIVLTCVLAVSAFAGQIPSVPGPEPQPSQNTAPGEIPSVGIAEQLSSEALSTLLGSLGFLTV